MLDSTVIMTMGLADNDAIIKMETDRVKTLEMVERLRGIDADLDDLLEAVLYIKGEKEMILYSANTFLEFGLINNSEVVESEKKRLRMMEIIKSNKSIENLMDAVAILKGSN